MKLVSVLILLLAIVGRGVAAEPVVTAKISPSEIAAGHSATLTITTSGDNPPRIVPPDVPGLEFSAVSQSRRIESVNGVTTMSYSVTYQVMARSTGTYVIGRIAPGVEPLTLRVTAASNSAPAGEAPAANEAPAFVRLLLPQRDLYVGQSVPVEIQVGTRDGVVASLNGLPTFNGDAFTLDKLANEPESRTEEMVDGKPFTVFTWHSVLAAIKPGTASLQMQTPLTVRIPVPRPAARFLDDAGLEDVYDDPAFQGFFGGSAQKEISVASPPTRLTVLELPADGRPKDFSGAVGQFKIAAELADPKIVAGDPSTLRMKISGEGNFDRVNSPMLGDDAHWKTYKATSKFTSADGTRYKGSKAFEQPVVATQAGRQTLPALAFSYFDPASRRYETAHSDPLVVDVQAAAGAAAANRPTPAAQTASAAPSPSDTWQTALRADHLTDRMFAATRIPFYFQPRLLALPALLLAAVPGLWLWLRQRERAGQSPAERRSASRVVDPGRRLAEMSRASQTGDAVSFFQAARSALQQAFSTRWQISPEAVTLDEIESRLGTDSDVRKLFVLADEAQYAGDRVPRADLDAWMRVVRAQIKGQTTP